MVFGFLAIGVFTFVLLVAGALFLTFLAVIVDRFNFEHKPFYPKRIRVLKDGDKRDSKGAHIIQKVEPDETTTEQP